MTRRESDAIELDESQYSIESIKRYEAVFGQDFISPGGIEMARQLCRRLAISNDSHVLDVGCGLGGAAFLMAHEFDAHVDAIDLSHNMIDSARLRLSANGLGDKVSIIHADCVEFGRSETYDAIYSRDVFLHINNKPDLFANLKRLLKPDGRILFTDYCCSAPPWSDEFSAYVKERGYRLHTVDEYADIVRDAGFTNVHASDTTTQFINTLQEEIERIASGKFDEAEREYLYSSWQTKLQRAERGEQRWCLVEASVND